MASPVVELNQQNDSSLASKSTRLHASVDSVPVHDPRDEKNKEVARKCMHFSIRGYVSEVRKRDSKLCYPFTRKDSTDLRDELPPMTVPNFRWWRCISCVPEAKNNLLKDSCRAGNGEAQNDVNADASKGQSSKVNNAARIRNTEASTSTDSNDNKNYSPISADRKGKGKAHVNDEIPPSPGCENGFLKVSSSQRIPQQILGQIEDDPSAEYEVEPKLIFNQNGATNALHKDQRTGRTEIGPSEGYVTREVDCVTKTCQGEPQTNVVAGVVSGSYNHSQGLVNLPDLNEFSGEPSYEVKNEVKVTGNNINQFFEDDDDYLGAERRKKPKVRLLSELLGLKQTQNPVKGKKKTLSSASSQDEHIKQKIVVSQDEGFKSMEIKGTSEETKKIVGTSEISESVNGSDDSDDVSTEKISKALAKRRCKPKDPSLEKCNKKIKVDHGDSSSLFRQKIKPKSSHEKGNSSEGLSQYLDFFTRLSEKNSVLTRKRGRVSQKQKVPTSPSKTRMPKECETTQKDGEAVPNANEIVRKASENGHYFLSSCLNKENDQLCVPRKDELIAVNSVLKDKENRNIGETSVTTRPTSAGALFIGNPSDGERNICPTANSSVKKTGTREADEFHPIAQHMPMQVSNSDANQKELNNEIRGRIQDIDINSIPADDKTNEQGVGDDIPMDIVELMAKNQYERHLNDPKDKHVSAGPPLSGTFVRQNESYGSHGQHVKIFPQICKPPSTDTRIPMFNDDLRHYTYYNTNHLSVRGLPRENPVSARFLSPTQGQDHIRPYSNHGLTPNYWNGNLNAAVGQRYPPSFLQAVDSYQKHKGMAPRQSITNSHRVWPSGITSRMPLGITNPQMISPTSNNVLNKGRIHNQSSGSFLNFDAASASNLQKQQNLNFSNAESSARSVDVNEAIPAMHLLSLMQNAAKMKITDLSLGPQKVVGPTSFRYPFSKNNSRTTAMQDNSCHPCYPTARPFPLAYQNDSGNVGRNSAGFVDAIPLTLRGQRNMENSHFGPSSGTHRPLRRPMAPPPDKGKGVASLSKPAYLNNSVQTMNDSSKLQYVAGVRQNEKTVSPAPDKVICQLNRNPSEFNDLKLVAKFMIGPEDLKPRKMARNRAPRPRGISKKQNIKAYKPIPSLTTAKS